ncbi:hypothetical protein EJ05DRAFT_527365 [Pseudovirgaria hyperparasitica]|uniref:Uncharacterized protein n=1 Tax=Pseudovirgaria hyperparasitica TaxID=470096 RepID=A0A6A6WAK7_9PEZI|nr:uncharacterized protein EJ05DRAFT_527365 [Pseudovirgaria hyperparasitica]KAF2759209.1 hypothetical protein EJ05DRAFT_527365 [Pseudovirgaria hyperparasitica]
MDSSRTSSYTHTSIGAYSMQNNHRGVKHQRVVTEPAGSDRSQASLRQNSQQKLTSPTAIQTNCPETELLQPSEVSVRQEAAINPFTTVQHQESRHAHAPTVDGRRMYDGNYSVPRRKRRKPSPPQLLTPWFFPPSSAMTEDQAPSQLLQGHTDCDENDMDVRLLHQHEESSTYCSVPSKHILPRIKKRSQPVWPEVSYQDISRPGVSEISKAPDTWFQGPFFDSTPTRSRSRSGSLPEYSLFPDEEVDDGPAITLQRTRTSHMSFDSGIAGFSDDLRDGNTIDSKAKGHLEPQVESQSSIESHVSPRDYQVLQEMTQASQLRGEEEKRQAEDREAAEDESETEEESEKMTKKADKDDITVPSPQIIQLYGLVQELFAHDPFKMIIACIFMRQATPERRTKKPTKAALEKTAKKTADAIREFWRFIALHPTPAEVAITPSYTTLEPPRQGRVVLHGLCEIFNRLGDWRGAETIIDISKMWLHKMPIKGQRFHISHEEHDIILGDDNAPKNRSDAFEISHLPGISAYELDCFRIFSRDILRGKATNFNGGGATDPSFQPEWTRVLPRDETLKEFVKWMWLKKGMCWNKSTGVKRALREDEMEKTRVALEQQEKSIESRTAELGGLIKTVEVELLNEWKSRANAECEEAQSLREMECPATLVVAAFWQNNPDDVSDDSDISDMDDLDD